jgi:hypothetical protein
MSRIIYLAPQPHRCNPPARPLGHEDPHPLGTIWECDCEKRWLRKRDPRWAPLRWYHLGTNKKIQAHQRLITRRAANQ